MPEISWWPTSRDNVTVNCVASADLSLRVAQDIAERLNAAITARGVAVLCVPGGKSPVPIFEALRMQDIDWSKVRITLTDERCVPRTHPDSNAQLVKKHLLQDRAARAQLVCMVASNVEPVLPPTVLAKEAAMALQAAGPADVLMLGMGADGHTASLFPEAPNLRHALHPLNTQVCVPIELPRTRTRTDAPYPRVTQTLAQLLSARHIVLPLAGADKLHTLRLAWETVSDHCPISYVLHQKKTPVAVWLTT